MYPRLLLYVTCRSSRFVVFSSDTCNYRLLSLEVASSSLFGFLSPESVPVPWLRAHETMLWAPDTGASFAGVTVGRASWEKGLFCIWLYIRASKQFSTIWGNWSHRVKFQLVNTFRLRDSNSINVFVKKQIYLQRVLRIMPKPFVLNNRKALKLKESF